MKVTEENILMIIRTIFNLQDLDMNKVIELKILEPRSMTQIQAEVFCSVLKGSFKDSLGKFSKIYSHFVECGRFIVIKSGNVVDSDETIKKVIKRIAKLLIATASDSELSLYAGNVKKSKTQLVAERDKLQQQFRKRKKKKK